MKSNVSLVAALIAAGLAGQQCLANSTPCAFAGGPIVGGIGLANLLGQWTGAATYPGCPPTTSIYDLNKDCRVNGLDLAIYLGAWGTSCAATSTELAGNSLLSYPFFEYVRAFNQTSNVEIAIDPGRFPSIVGKTCDIYVVNAKTAAQWMSDPSLTDVTLGGFQVQTFVAGTIQANTFSISGGAGLNGTTGTQVGIGYDMVCDCNQNGMLDAGDFIDGLSAEAGFYVVRDTTAAGPFTPVESGLTGGIAGYTVTGITSASHTRQEAYWPSNIASMGQLPLIIMSHGNGHNFQWYDHLGNHLASYGYIVMTHQNNTGPGVNTAAVTTIQHTNAFIAQQATIDPDLGGPAPAGLFNGHIDTNNIVWMGHSRGGEGITIAYDHLFDGTALTGGPYAPVGWTLASLKLLDSLCPVDFNGPVTSNPHDKPTHLWTAAGDSDVSGCASQDLLQTFHIVERATKTRMSTVVYGTGHGDFHNFGGFFTGPCPIGVAATNQIERGYWLPLVKHFLEGDIPSKDFLWRQWERFRPIGAPATGVCAPPSGTGDSIVVNHFYRDDPAAAAFIIDDYTFSASTAVSSSGGAVTFNVSNLTEGQNNDNNADFTWSAADPMNGNTLARTTDLSNGVVFDWDGPAFYQQGIVPAGQNFTTAKYLSFRAAQGTRHPNTIAALMDLTFDVVLVDGAGNTSRINIASYGGGIEEPYQRTGCGTGTGWHNDFETIRVRLTDFLNNGSPLNLANVVAVRFEFGGPGTSTVGRLALNEIYLTAD